MTGEELEPDTASVGSLGLKEGVTLYLAVRLGTPPPASSGQTTVTTPNSNAGLPAGWEMRVLPDGRNFFVNHNNRTTQVTAIESCAWALFFLTVGCLQWNDPRSAPVHVPAIPAAGSQGLPAGWEKRMTPQGQMYYVNHTTKATQWNPPTN